jgi:hypothetical protein
MSQRRKVCLDSLRVTCSPLDPRFIGSNPAKVDGVLKVIKIHNKASFGRSHIIYLQHVKELSTHHKRLVKAKLEITFGCQQSSLLCS